MHSVVRKGMPPPQKKDELDPVRLWATREKGDSGNNLVMTNISIHFSNPMTCPHPVAQQTLGRQSPEGIMCFSFSSPLHSLLLSHETPLFFYTVCT